MLPTTRQTGARRAGGWIAISSQRLDAATRRPSSTWFVRARVGCSRSHSSILRDVDRAEDALQDALVIAWRDLRGLRDPDRFDPWLRRLLVNVCIREATRERRRAANLRVAAGRRTGRARRPALPRRPGPTRARISPAAARPAGHPRAPSLRGLRPGRDRRHARHPARDRPLPTPSRPSRDAGRPRRRRAHDRLGGRSA